MARMKDDELEALLARQQHNAVGALNGTIGRHRADLLDRYFGEPYGDEVEGRSQITDTTIRDTVESIKPELMDIFTGGDAVVQFDPRGAEDVDAAKQETDICNHIFMQKNNGFMVLYSWFTDALLVKNGYVKRYWDDRKRIEIEEYDDLSPEEAAALVEELESTSDEVEFLERDGGIDEETGEVSPLYLKIRRTTTEKRYVVENVPAEQVYVSPQWNRVDFIGCPFVAHRRPMTVSDLVEMGFDKKQVEELPDHDANTDTEEAENRFDGEHYSENDHNNTDPAMREVLVFENYVRCDRNGDGIAELLQVFTAGQGGQILKRNGKPAIEEVSDTPFECLTSLPIPHKHFGMSIAELVQDLQRIKTVLTRQLLDNTVIGNNPDIIVDEDRMTPNTVEDLQVTQPGRVIRASGGAAAIQPFILPSTIQGSLAAIQYVDELKQERTGVTKYTQGLDADSLNKTATGIKNIMSAAQKKILLVARIFAETGVKSLFLNMHRDLRNGPVKKIAVQLNNEWVQVNPRMWRHRADMTVNVGLGTGDRDIQFQRLMMILQQQKEGLAAGMAGYEHVHHTLVKMTELAGFKDVSNFWPDPEEVAQRQQQAAQQEKPQDPAMILAQVEMQKTQAKLQTDQMRLQLDQMKAQMDAQKFQMDQRLKQLQLLMTDDRERDLAAAKIEADEAARMQMAVDGPALTKNERQN